MTDMLVNGRRIGWSALQSGFVCRKCRARIGRSYADPFTGELDHERMVCASAHEHDIQSQSDIMSKAQAEWLDARERATGEAVLDRYSWLAPKRAAAITPSLYGDDDFKGFD